MMQCLTGVFLCPLGKQPKYIRRLVSPTECFRSLPSNSCQGRNIIVSETTIYPHPTPQCRLERIFMRSGDNRDEFRQGNFVSVFGESAFGYVKLSFGKDLQKNMLGSLTHTLAFVDKYCCSVVRSQKQRIDLGLFVEVLSDGFDHRGISQFLMDDVSSHRLARSWGTT